MVSDYQQLHQYGTGSRTELYWNECHRRQEEYQYGCMCVCGCAHNSTKELPAKQKRHSPETMQWKRIFQIGVRAARQKHRKRPHTQNSQALSSNMANYFHIYEPGPPGRLGKTMQRRQTKLIRNKHPTHSRFFADSCPPFGFFSFGTAGDIKWKEALAMCHIRGAFFMHAARRTKGQRRTWAGCSHEPSAASYNGILHGILLGQGCSVLDLSSRHACFSARKSPWWAKCQSGRSVYGSMADTISSSASEKC